VPRCRARPRQLRSRNPYPTSKSFPQFWYEQTSGTIRRMPCSRCHHLVTVFLALTERLRYAEQIKFESSPVVREACEVALRDLEAHQETHRETDSIAQAVLC
jgi:hypothetical protein